MTDKEVIAEFMGMPAWENHTEFSGEHKVYKKLRKLPYDTSWDWLMPVIEKIYCLDIYYKYVKETSGQFENRIELCTNINIVYEAVVEFIKWYNQQK